MTKPSLKLKDGINIENPEKKDLFWGWYIVAAAFVIMGVNFGSRYCFAIFVDPIAADLHWSRSAISLGATISILFYSLGGIYSGRLLDRMAPKRIVTIGLLVQGLAFIAMSVVQTPLQFNLIYGILSGAGASFSGVVVCGSYVGKWFDKKRGMAIGISSMGIGAATMVLPFVAGPIVKAYGWRAGFVALGCLIILLGTVAAQFGMGRTKPDDYSLLPDGERAPAPIEPACGNPVAALENKNISYLRDFRFWILVFCFSIAIIAEMFAFVHQVAFATDNGMGRIAADASISVIGMTSIAGRYFFGWICDRLRDAKYAACIGFLAMAAGIGILLHVRTEYGLYAYAALFGFGYGSLATVMPYLLADRFGSAMLGTLYGMLTFLTVASGALGPILGGYIYDKTGAYDPAWNLMFVSLIVISLAVLWLKKK